MYIGIDIGGTKIRVASGDGNLKLGTVHKIPTPTKSANGLSHIAALIDPIVLREQTQAIAVSSSGPLDFKKGIITTPPNVHWHNTKIVPYLKKRYGLPVVIENDANTAALAEQHLGAGKGSKVMLFVTISTGIGTGLVLDGRIYHGAHDTEGGHIVIDPAGPVCGCGGRGHFEGIVSGRAIERDYGRIARDIHDAKIWDEIGANVAAGLSSLITAYSPDTVVLGGGVGGVHYDSLHRPLMKHLEKSHLLYPLPKIRRAKFTETAPLYGCFILARDFISQ